MQLRLKLFSAMNQDKIQNVSNLYALLMHLQGMSTLQTVWCKINRKARFQHVYSFSDFDNYFQHCVKKYLKINHWKKLKEDITTKISTCFPEHKFH